MRFAEADACAPCRGWSGLRAAVLAAGEGTVGPPCAFGHGKGPVSQTGAGLQSVANPEEAECGLQKRTHAPLAVAGAVCARPFWLQAKVPSGRRARLAMGKGPVPQTGAGLQSVANPEEAKCGLQKRTHAPLSAARAVCARPFWLQAKVPSGRRARLAMGKGPFPNGERAFKASRSLRRRNAVCRSGRMRPLPRLERLARGRFGCRRRCRRAVARVWPWERARSQTGAGPFRLR